MPPRNPGQKPVVHPVAYYERIHEKRYSHPNDRSKVISMANSERQQDLAKLARWEREDREWRAYLAESGEED